jgi:plasmid stabilization system protein ParE
MKKFELVIEEVAQLDIDESASWYRQIGSRLSLLFLAEVRVKLSYIESNPHLYPEIYHSIHQAILHKFPYALYYYILDNQIIVIGCLHTSRNRDRILEERQ